MRRFYHVRHLIRMVANIVVTFPVIVFPSVFTLVTFKVNLVVRAFLIWKKRCFRNPLVRFGGYLILTRWMRKFRNGTFPAKLKRARSQMMRIGRPRSDMVPEMRR